MYFQVRGLAEMKFPRRLKRVADLVNTVVPGVPDRGQEPAVTGKQGVGEDAPAVMAQGRGDDHGRNLPFWRGNHKRL